MKVFVESPLCRKITFTGSTDVGQKIAAQAAPHMKRLSLELGGHAPAIVLADADLEVAAKQAAAGKLRNAGQSCIAINRLYVESSVAERFIPRLVQEVSGYKVGDGLDENIHVGSLINQEGLDKVLEHIDDAAGKGAKIECGGKRLTNDGMDRGFFVSPAVLTGVTDAMKCMQEETFGPVLPVMVVKNREEAIRRANDTPYGLSAYLFTTSIKNALEVGEALEAGTIGVNDSVPSTTIAPFGGYKLSGMGRECGTEGIEAFLETKHLSFNIE
jgi:succinate-semialdehyde dehydrogenase/glutarate-semialdehyde dehydrogenase